MNIAPFVFVGLFAVFSASWYGFVFKPQAEIGRTELFKDKITGAVYPMARSGQAMQGAEVYRAQGCAACHTQQVRGKGQGNDIERGWGVRHTVAPDYMLDNPPQLGAIRLGPDLANVARRQTDATWHYLHLYNPKGKVTRSNMPPYPYLFEKRKIGSAGPGVGIALPDEAGMEIVPKDDARSLVAYLLSLKTEGLVFEAPMPQIKTNAPAGDTNAPVAVAPATK